MAVLITYLFLTYGGGSSVFLEFINEKIDTAKIVMVKDERQKDAINILELMGDRSEEHRKLINETDDQLSTALANRHSMVSEISTIADKNFENIAAYSSDILDLRFQLKEHVSREEWAQIFE